MKPLVVRQQLAGSSMNLRFETYNKGVNGYYDEANKEIVSPCAIPGYNPFSTIKIIPLFREQGIIWEVSETSADWITYNVVKNGVNLKLAENRGDERRGFVKIKASTGKVRTVDIRQEAFKDWFRMNLKEYNNGDNGLNMGNLTVESPAFMGTYKRFATMYVGVDTSLPDLSFSIDGDDWLRVDNADAKGGIITVQRNTAKEPRTGYVVVTAGGEERGKIKVTQAGVDPDNVVRLRFGTSRGATILWAKYAVSKEKGKFEKNVYSMGGSYASTDLEGVCPEGFTVPTSDMFTDLFDKDKNKHKIIGSRVYIGPSAADATVLDAKGCLVLPLTKTTELQRWWCSEEGKWGRMAAHFKADEDYFGSGIPTTYVECPIRCVAVQ
jgi:uncharacterized protein (TIGR02145 family)